MRKPLVILVSGAPGAGKTTLAANLSQHLRIAHIPRDEIMRGVEMTRGVAIDKGTTGIKIYYDLLIHMLESGVSLVTDGTIYKGVSERDIIEYLGSRSTLVNVHARAKNEHQRFIERERDRVSRGWENDWVEGHMSHLEAVYPRAVEPLALGVPIIEVDATDGYSPAIPEVVSRIREIYTDTRIGIKKHEEKM